MEEAESLEAQMDVSSSLQDVIDKNEHDARISVRQQSTAIMILGIVSFKIFKAF